MAADRIAQLEEKLEKALIRITQVEDVSSVLGLCVCASNSVYFRGMRLKRCIAINHLTD